MQELKRNKINFNISLEAPLLRRWVKWAYFISRVVKEGLSSRLTFKLRIEVRVSPRHPDLREVACRANSGKSKE